MQKLTDFAPDLDPTTPGVITDCTNLISTIRGYAGGPSGANVGIGAPEPHPHLTIRFA